MRILAIIPARGGSKRLPGKNIKLLGGKPLINWTLDAVKGIPEICDILVSTDDSEIASIAKKGGAYVPWLRPNELSNDEASSVDVAIHALDWYEKEHGNVDGLMLLQPTSPFREQNTIKTGITLFRNNGLLPVIGVSRVGEHPEWMFKEKNNLLVPFLDDHSFDKRSQDLATLFIVNGGFYLLSPIDIRMRHSFFGTTNIPLIVISPKEQLDIDTHNDFELAEFFLERNN